MTFCIWKHCANDDDCDSPGVLECKTVPDSDPEEEFKICEYVETTEIEVERPSCER